jgi:beta-glucosidase
VIQLLGYARVQLEAGEGADITFDVPTSRLAFSDRRMVRVVEPGLVEVSVGASCAEMVLTGSVTLTGDVHEVGIQDRRLVGVSIRRFAGA